MSIYSGTKGKKQKTKDEISILTEWLSSYFEMYIGFLGITLTFSSMIIASLIYSILWWEEIHALW